MSEFVKSNLREPGNPSDAAVLDSVHVCIANNQHVHRRALQQAYDEIDRLNAELVKLQAEREPRDNGDGTVTAMLPVTYPKGLDVVEVRTRRRGDPYATSVGTADESDADELSGTPGNVWLILRPAKKPPEPVTWEAPLVDGEWIAGERSFRKGRPDLFAYEWEHLGSVFRGLRKPHKLGTYQFKDGVGTLIEASQ